MNTIVFDLDGTLVDTLDDVAAALNHALARHGLQTHSTSKVAAWIGDGVAQLAERAAREASPATIASLVADYRSYYDAHLLEYSKPYAGIVPLLDALEARGHQLAVLTNKTESTAREVVDALFPRRFASIVGFREGRPPKPDPAPLLELSAALGFEPVDGLLLGDTEVDIRTASACGMPCLAATWGFRSPDQLRAERPLALVDHPSEVLAFVA